MTATHALARATGRRHFLTRLAGGVAGALARPLVPLERLAAWVGADASHPLPSNAPCGFPQLNPCGWIG